ncbi:Uma2 family endonuclease [Streptomyces sp. 184]|uniref:Uma2 family endonuclease n=1 Tax=Streptomyces sp. 184 TaxID=1827526 RepID=UPI003892373B
MSVAPKKPEHTAPAWPVPPSGGYTADDLDTLPDLPPHTELIDGSLVFTTPQSIFHMVTIRMLENGLLRTVPGDLAVLREMTVVIGEHQRPEPDLIAVRRDAATKLAQTSCQAEDVLLAVEVVSPESVDRDRETKPLKYAKAGIQHFWRVENKREQAVVHVYQLDDATRNYMLTGIHTDRLKLSLPYEIDIDLTLAY